jgi:hypothetical protein
MRVPVNSQQRLGGIHAHPFDVMADTSTERLDVSKEFKGGSL